MTTTKSTATAKKTAAKKAPARKTAAKPKNDIPPSSRDLYAIEVGGETYMLRSPKGYAGILIANRFQTIEEQGEEDFDSGYMLESIDLLINAIFTKSDRVKIRERLSDAEDDLDMPDLMEAFTVLSEKATENPTT